MNKNVREYCTYIKENKNCKGRYARIEMHKICIPSKLQDTIKK